MTLECDRVLRYPFPAPPGIIFPQSNGLNRRTVYDFCEFANEALHHSPAHAIDQMNSSLENVQSVNWAVLQFLMFLCIGFILVNRRRLRRLLHHQYRFAKTPYRNLRNSPYQQPVNPPQTRVIDVQNTPIVHKSFASEQPITSNIRTLRRRNVDTWKAVVTA